MLQFDGERSTGLYDIRQDELMKENILEKNDVQEEMERELKAIIQQYMNRMLNDRLTADSENIKN